MHCVGEGSDVYWRELDFKLLYGPTEAEKKNHISEANKDKQREQVGPTGNTPPQYIPDATATGNKGGDKVNARRGMTKTESLDKPSKAKIDSIQLGVTSFIPTDGKVDVSSTVIVGYDTINVYWYTKSPRSGERVKEKNKTNENHLFFISNPVNSRMPPTI